tara:strand:+ start:742 stop:966 length:225 start_codon:yes stop_codon:yes gene_type:complete
MRIVSEGGSTWGVIEEPLDKKHTQMQKVYVEITSRHMMMGEEPHGRTCTCFPCEQATYREDRDDPSVGGYAPTN